MRDAEARWWLGAISILAALHFGSAHPLTAHKSKCARRLGCEHVLHHHLILFTKLTSRMSDHVVMQSC